MLSPMGVEGSPLKSTQIHYTAYIFQLNMVLIYSPEDESTKELLQTLISTPLRDFYGYKTMEGTKKKKVI